MPLSPSARDFLDRVVQRYRALQGYADQGTVHLSGRLSAVVRRFETAYQAPDLWRLAVESPHPYAGLRHLTMRVVVGHQDGQAYLWMQGYRQPATLRALPDLPSAVAAATGVSSGAAHIIGHLLLPGVGGWALTDLRRPRFRRRRVVDGTRCVAISGLHPRGGRMTAWFGEHDLLLRWLLTTCPHGDERRFDIRTDAVVPSARIAPPALSAAPGTRAHDAGR
jgi:hypothetical protein